MEDRDFVAFLQWALPRLRMRWSGFRKVRRQVRNRLARRMAVLGLRDLAAYRARLEADPAEWCVLDGLCRVTISRFLRDRMLWRGLAEQVLPELGREGLRAWSAGCASGEEPYGLVLTWQLGTTGVPAENLEVLATDTDPSLLERARLACYPEACLREVPGGWRAAAFEAGGETFCLREVFREPVTFEQHDVRGPAPAGPFDLVLCRNLAFTYFASEVQREVLARLCGVLRPGGVLVIGGLEALPEPHGLTPWPGVRCAWRA